MIINYLISLLFVTAMRPDPRSAVRSVFVQSYQMTSNAYVSPWVVRVMNNNTFVCGGAYYRPLYVLTSAGCLYQYKKDLDNLSVEFIAGDSFALIKTVYVPRQYEWRSNFMDVAVIKLAAPLPRYEAEYVQLCEKQPRDYRQLTVISCGVPKHQVIRTQEVSYMSKMDCTRKYPKIELSESIGCTRQYSVPDECMFDFGCPVTAEDKLCGIVAYGPECDNPELPGLFTEITQVKYFISKAISKDKYQLINPPA